MADNNVEWTSEQMIENASNWSLAGDVALLNSLKKFSESLLSETVLVSGNVDDLLNNLENVSLRLDLVKNEFQGLRNTQFIENRVYEDDETLDNDQPKKEEKELTEEEKENVVRESIVTGLKVMEKYFDKVEVTVSDSEEDNEKSYILRPKDPYAERPLPYMVGSQDWYKKWHVGLLLSESESESEKEEEAYSSSDSEECLPKDRILGSETSSELDFTNRNAGPVANSTFNDSEDRRREIFQSSDESSEQSSSYPVKTPISNQNFAEQLAAKLGDVINSTNETPVPANRNPIKKNSQSTKYGNLFSDEPPPLDDLDDTVLPKSAHKGLFSGGKDLFADDDEDLFWGQQNKTISAHNAKEQEVNDSLSSHAADKLKPKVTKGLFDESESSSEEDMFTAAEKRKAKISQPYLQPYKTILPFVDDQPPDISSKVEVAPSKKKPIGGVSIFGEKTNLFGENSGKPGFESAKTVEASQKNQVIGPQSLEIKKSPLKKTSLFDEFSDEDIEPLKNKLTQAKKPEVQQNTKKLSLFDDTDDMLPSKPEQIENKSEEKNKSGLFDEEKNITLPKKTEIIKPTGQKKKLSLFDDDDEHADLFKPPSKENSSNSKISNKEEKKKSFKKISLFDDDDDDFLKEEEDIFTRGPKKKGLFEAIDEKSSIKSSRSLFDDLEADSSSENISKLTNNSEEKIDKSKQNKAVKSLLEDTKQTKSSVRLSVTEEIQAKHSPKGLFDDLEVDPSSENISKIPSNSIENIDESKPKKAVRSLLADTEQTKSSIRLSANEGIQAKESTRGLFDDLEDDSSSNNTSEIHNSEDNSKKYENESKARNPTKSLLEDTEQIESSSKSAANEEVLSKKSSRGLFDDLEAEFTSENISRIPSSEDSSRSKEDTGIQSFDEGKLEKKPPEPLFESLNTSGSSENLFGDSKSTTTGSKEHLIKEAENEHEVTTKSMFGVVKSAIIPEKSEERDHEENSSSAEKKKPTKILFDNDTNSEDEEAIFKSLPVGKSPKIPKEILFREEPDADKHAFDNVSTSGEIREQFSKASEEILVSKKQMPEDVVDTESEENNTDLNIVKAGENMMKEQTEHSESILKQTKESLLGKIRKNVGFVDSDSDSDTASDDNFEPERVIKNKVDPAPNYKDIIEDAATEPKNFEQNSQRISGPGSINESPPKVAEAPKIYTIPPPIDLFDPNPPPPDPNWDAASDSSNSDTFSLTDGILDRTNFTQSQARSSLFDEAPPSLDANESSGIVRDLNVTRIETDDSSFYPYASSSRRLSSDIFSEQQSQDSFFVTKNRTDLSAQHGSSLGRIPEDTSSKIEEITPSGSFGDFEESSVFERTDDSKNEENMGDIMPNSDVQKPQVPRRTSLFENLENESSVGANVKKNVKLFEESPNKEDKSPSSPIKTSPGKLKHNLNINVAALMPGAAQPKFRPSLGKSVSLDETDKSAQSISAMGGASVRPPLLSRPARPRSELLGDTDGAMLGKDDGHFEKLHNTEVLPSATKDRARIPVKRRPSTRRARQEAVRKSMTDFSLYQNEEGSSIIEEPPPKDEIESQNSTSNSSSFLEDLNSKIMLDNDVLKRKTTDVEDIADKSEESPEVRGVSLVFGSKSEISSILPSEVSSSVLEKSSVEDEEFRSTELRQNEEPKVESKSIFEDSFKKEDSLFSTSKILVKKNTSLFGAEQSDSSDEDLFSSTKKSSQMDKVLSSTKSEERSTKNEQKKTSIFSDKSTSDSEGELFGNLPKTSGVVSTKKFVPEASKKGSLFDDLEDSEDELFGTKTSKSGSGNGDPTGNKDEENMGDIMPNSDVQKPQVPRRTSLFENLENESSVGANVKKNVKLFEESPNKEDKSPSSPIKTSPGKLKHNLNINVAALMPGAAQPKFRPSLGKSVSLDETDKSAQSISAMGGASVRPPLLSRPARPRSELLGDTDGAMLGKDDGHFEKLHNTEVLPSATKDRARIPVKRRPSTRRARQEAVRKSMTDFSLYQNEEGSSIIEEPPPKDEIESQNSTSNSSSFLEDLNSKIMLDNDVLKRKTTDVEDIADKSEESPEVRGVSLVFGSKSEISSILPSEVSSSVLEKSSVEDEEFRSTELRQNEEPKVESKSIFEDSFKKEDSLFSTSKILVKKNTSLFGAEQSDSSDEDLFSSTKKSSQMDKVLSSTKSEERSTKNEQKKTSIFSDKSTSDSEGELFGNLPKTSGVVSTKKFVPEASKKGSLFDDLEDSEDELFGTKTSKSGSGNGDPTGNKDEENMGDIMPNSDVQKPQVPRRTSLFENLENESSVGANVKKNVKLFEESPNKEDKSPSSPIKTSPGKLKHNLNINVAALMPGAAQPKFRPSLGKSVSLDETDKSAQSISAMGGASVRPPLLSRPARPRSELLGDTDGAMLGKDDGHFEKLHNTEVLPSATKDRARIPVKRRPSTRRARQEAVRKSMTDFSLYQNEEGSSIIEEPPPKDEIESQNSTSNSSSFLEDLNSKIMLDNDVLKRKTTDVEDIADKSEESPEVRGVSLVFGSKSEISSILPSEVSSSVLEKSSVEDEEFRSTELRQNEEPKVESKSIFEDSFKKEDSLFSTSKILVKKNTSLFGAEQSDSSDEDLFSSTKKSSQMDKVLSSTKSEERSTKNEQKKTSIFSDKSTSDSEGELFGNLPKTSGVVSTKKFVPEASKKGSLFDDLEDSEDELFGTKTSKSGSGNGDPTGNKDEENMGDIMPNSDVQKPQVPRRTSLFENLENESSVGANVKKNVKLFEESPNKEDKSPSSPIKTSPGKLKHNLNINVAALMPGAAQPKFRPSLGKSVSLDETDKSAQSISAMGGASVRPPLLSRPARPRSELLGDTDGAMLGKDDGHFEKLHNTEVLPSATKDRARIPVKRRPSTRRARQEAVRKSMTDFSLYQNEEGSSIIEEPPPKDEIESQNSTSNSSSFLEDLNSKIMLDNDVLKRKTTDVEDIADKSEESPEVRGVSLVFGSKSEISSILPSEVSSSVLEKSSVEDEEFRSTELRQNEEPKVESKSIFEDSFKKEDSLFSTSKILVKKNTSLFGAEQSDSSDEDLFSSTKKSSQMDKVLSSTKSEERSTKNEQKKTSIFSDKSTSDSEGELFGNLPKTSGVVSTKKFVPEASKKGSLFDDLEDSEDELFGTKTSKSGSGNGDPTGNKGCLGQRRDESKNVRVAAVKKLENKEVTDFDPLSALK